jgi:hypothetical protein
MMRHGSNSVGPTFDLVGTLVLACGRLAAMSFAMFQFLGGNFVVATLFPRMSRMVRRDQFAASATGRWLASPTGD